MDDNDKKILDKKSLDKIQSQKGNEISEHLDFVNILHQKHVKSKD